MSDVVERLRELLAKATPGPWKAHERPQSGTITGPMAASFVYVGDDPDDDLQRVLRCYTTDGYDGVAERQANLHLVTEAITALPDLLAEITRLRAELASAVAAVEDKWPGSVLSDGLEYRPLSGGGCMVYDRKAGKAWIDAAAIRKGG